MNEYGISTLQMIQMVGPLLFIGPLVVWMLLIGPLLIYPLARWKTNREAFADDQVGIKVAIHYFKMVAMHFLLIGGLMLLWTIISKGGGSKSSMYRAAFGFLVPAGIAYAAHFVFQKRTNDDVAPTVRRLFHGYNLIITGLFGFTFLVLATQVLFAKGSSGDEGRLIYAGMLVYGGAWVGLALQFSRLVLGNSGMSAGPPTSLGTQQPPVSQASGGPSLPPLGSAFPPIDQR